MYRNWRHRNPDPPDWTDTMQVCENGHQITAYAVSSPHSIKSHCPDCGAKTITQCPKCQMTIPGQRHCSVFFMGGIETPAHCHGCGEPFPWKDKLQAIAATQAEEMAPKKRGKKAAASAPQHIYHGPIINGPVTNSSIQHAGPNSTQSVSTGDDGAGAKEAIRILLEVLERPRPRIRRQGRSAFGRQCGPYSARIAEAQNGHHSITPRKCAGEAHHGRCGQGLHIRRR